MPTRRPSHMAGKADKTLPPVPSKTRPGLAVDTSFSRHCGNAPEQVYPHVSKTQAPYPYEPNHTVTLSRDSAQAKNDLVGTQNEKQADVVTRKESNLAARRAQQASNLDPAVHKRIKGLRPSPLDLNNEISPSDRAITIGLAIPSAAMSTHTQSPQSGAPYPHSPPHLKQPQRYGYEIATPTIVITPAKEDFDVRSSAFLEAPGRRPTSSVYSRHTNGLSRGPIPNQRTPPVPALPKFAAKSNASLRTIARDSAATKFEEDDSPPLVFQSHVDISSRKGLEHQEDEASRSLPRTIELSRKNSQHVPTPRRSKGWWNVITSPFSAKSGAFSFRSPSLEESDEDVDREPMLGGASDMGVTDHSLSQSDGNGTRSAPPTDPVRNFSFKARVRTPQRSDTAPGAINSGNSADVNIYRTPDDGEASSYYDSKRNFPSMVGPKAGARPRALEDIGDFDPRKSCYQGPKSMRESEFYRIPEGGEAAEYYDSNRTFPSLVPYGWEYGDKGLEGWSPRRSVMPKDAAVESGSLTESPSNIETAGADKEGPAGQAKVVEQSTVQSSHAAEFEGFSGAYGPTERKFFTTPSEDELRGRSSGVPKITPYALSPTSEATPIVEDAHMATYIGPQSSNGEPREVDIASTRTPTPSPPVPRNGLGNATMATREAPIAAPISEKPPYPVTEHSRSASQGLGISDDEAERGLFPPPPTANEKSGTDSEYPQELPLRKRKSGCRWICCFVPVVFGILMAALVFLCVFFIPFPHVDEPVQAQWLNLTGFPALPTGISTVIGPKPANEVTGCVSQEQLWTCALPADEAYMANSDQLNQPNFRFEIRFRSNIVPSTETAQISSNSTLLKRSTSQTAQAGALVKRTAWTNLLFTSSPAPPSIEDQTFIGRTTDNNSIPFDGEETPFYISLLEAGDLTSNYIPGLQKRDPKFHYPYPTTSSAASSGTASSSPTSASSASTVIPAGPTSIPQQAIRSDGKPAPAVLYPFAYAQPLRLFNRGQSSEHYGFYVYFDRSMYLSLDSTSNSSTIGGSSIRANVPLANANAVCTWSQTRMLVQIWTRKAAVTSLSGSTPSNIALTSSSANDMAAPGSFPYAVTMTLDRHGGDASEKGVYCNSLNSEQQVTDTVHTWIAENRAFGGELVNPAAVPMSNGTSLTKRSDEAGIDGGSGGCACQWQNWG